MKIAMRKPVAPDKSGLLFDEAVKFFVWVAKKNPRTSEVFKYFNKNFKGRFNPPDMFKLVFDANSNPDAFIDRLLIKGRKLDKNFEGIVMRLLKKCGEDVVKLPKQLKEQIDRAVAREIERQG